ncbi:metallo-beta-lactamase domain-containing protein 1 [Cephus cinctus]|uniref:Metallo-beta-lactamase domain-containing protein 1 n=1 Tax=Cephus cinctus TaxID=211228 RepID=A0AAJ7FVB0_CEPCN|nr:metallo-beta-lactamase domain-containing protein 1 [Cephus cinctus]
MNEVIVLFDGYSKQLDDETMDANCSCTLIKGQKNIIVDTMTAWDRERLVEALHKQNLDPLDIHYVVCTHSHSDHIGNNNLFINAEHIVGQCVQSGTKFYEKRIKDGKYKLCEGVTVIATPGHTAQDVSVLVDVETKDGKLVYTITGDLFEKEEDIEDPSIWKALGTIELQEVQKAMRSHVLDLANIIIPGHGPMFPVTEAMKLQSKRVD